MRPSTCAASGSVRLYSRTLPPRGVSGISRPSITNCPTTCPLSATSTTCGGAPGKRNGVACATISRGRRREISRCSVECVPNPQAYDCPSGLSSGPQPSDSRTRDSGFPKSTIEVSDRNSAKGRSSTRLMPGWGGSAGSPQPAASTSAAAPMSRKNATPHTRRLIAPQNTGGVYTPDLPANSGLEAARPAPPRGRGKSRSPPRVE